MDIQLKPEFENAPMRGKCFKMPLEDQMEIQRQVDELVSAGLLMEYRDAEFPKYSLPTFLVEKEKQKDSKSKTSTSCRMVGDYRLLNARTLSMLVSSLTLSCVLSRRLVDA